MEYGDAVDVSGFPRTDEGYFILTPDVMLAHEMEDRGLDFFAGDPRTSIWSIGERKSDGVILAAFTSVFYEDPNFTCLWLR